MQYNCVFVLFIPFISPLPVVLERRQRDVSDNVLPENVNNENVQDMYDIGKVDKYLRMNGYLTDYPVSSNITANNTTRTEAIKQLQTFYGIEITGNIDTTTHTLMNARRCGCPDKSPNWKTPTRASFTVGFYEQKWTSTLNVTWKITQHYTGNTAVNLALQRSEIKRAFDLWSEVANINFTEVSGSSHITILFGSYDHDGGIGDQPFDGQGTIDIANSVFCLFLHSDKTLGQVDLAQGLSV